MCICYVWKNAFALKILIRIGTLICLNEITKHIVSSLYHGFWCSDWLCCQAISSRNTESKIGSPLLWGGMVATSCTVSVLRKHWTFPLVLTWNIATNIWFITCIGNYIHIKMWDVITHPYPNSSAGLVELSLMLQRRWQNTSHVNQLK